MPLFAALASIGGALISANANKKAAQQANAATQEAAAIDAGSIEQGLAAQVGGIRGSQQYSYQAMNEELAAVNDYIAQNWDRLNQESAIAQRGYDDTLAGYERLYSENAPGLSYLRNLVADPERLTAEQQRQLEESRRIAGEQIQASGYGGSGRTAAAMLGKVEGDMTAGMREANRALAAQAANTMAAGANKSRLGAISATGDFANRMGSITGGYYDRFGAATTKGGNIKAGYQQTLADNERSIGDATADARQKIGGVQSGAIRTSGENNAGVTTANARLAGQAMGDVAGAIASANKANSFGARMSRYA